MKSFFALASASVVLVISACSSSTSGTFIPNEGGVDGAPGGGGGTKGADGKTLTGGECDGTAASGNTCTGQACLSLKANKQGKKGICTESCDTGTCTKGGQCVNVPDLGQLCLQTCTSNANCIDGFVCVDGGNGAKFCLVEAGETPINDGGGGDRCAAAGCPVLTNNPSDVAGYCPGFPAATEVCDCPGAGPGTPCTTGMGANLYCCP